MKFVEQIIFPSIIGGVCYLLYIIYGDTLVYWLLGVLMSSYYLKQAYATDIFKKKNAIKTILLIGKIEYHIYNGILVFLTVVLWDYVLNYR